MRVKQSIDVVLMLADVRRENELTQDEVGKLMNTQKSNVSRFEKCVHSPTLRMLFRYADALGVELEFGIRKNSYDDNRKTQSFLLLQKS